MRLIVPLRRAAVPLLLAMLASGPAAAAEFVSGFADLPLMPGMAQIPGSDLSFDTLSGRIAIALARGKQDQAAIRAFYDSALPQLGWRRRPDDGLTREGEILTIDYLADGAETVVRFTLTPE